MDYYKAIQDLLEIVFSYRPIFYCADPKATFEKLVVKFEEILREIEEEQASAQVELQDEPSEQVMELDQEATESE